VPASTPIFQILLQLVCGTAFDLDRHMSLTGDILKNNPSSGRQIASKNKALGRRDLTIAPAKGMSGMALVTN